MRLKEQSEIGAATQETELAAEVQSSQLPAKANILKIQHSSEEYNRIQSLHNVTVTMSRIHTIQNYSKLWLQMSLILKTITDY